ncbi:DUF1501 domain-containing protein [Engelhardtia mirabilis]|uniref:DUF1501 domain-containing protein n=1 Tax=Engelhardtia mirabilis TaxID=2528011 RepID=A0A518BFP3_9BACT|nr:hypothetical protein Pla133_08670 [Planctomycetes bacterium Pla133]QDV00127.1 hypothetical protein Pla86_08660 [Planctomycetes bacterium Pla86]
MASTRREFLFHGVQIAAVTAVAPWALSRRAFASTDDGGARVLVVIELAGGNDGLNTVIPWRDERYHRARPTLAAAAAGAHDIGADLALHPSLPRCAGLLAAGELAIVQGVGYPQPDRSHFRSSDIWQTALAPDVHEDVGDVDRRTATGWLGRACSQLARRGEAAPLGVHVGDGPPPLSLTDAGAPGAAIGGDLTDRRRELPPAAAAARDALSAQHDGDRGELAFLRATARDGLELERRLEGAARVQPSADWPGTDLARKLRTIAVLVASGFPARVYTLRLGGFDTHADQAPVQASLLGELDGALGAFRDELAAREALGRVTTLVYSEFGRRVAENGTRGTDHGAAAPVFLLGGAVRGGLHGERPDLAHLEDGDVRHSTDFRSVYATLERDWLGVHPTSKRAPLDLLRG